MRKTRHVSCKVLARLDTELDISSWKLVCIDRKRCTASARCRRYSRCVAFVAICWNNRFIQSYGSRISLPYICIRTLKAEWDVNQQYGEEFKCYVTWQTTVAMLHWYSQLRTESDRHREKMSKIHSTADEYIRDNVLFVLSSLTRTEYRLSQKLTHVQHHSQWTSTYRLGCKRRCHGADCALSRRRGRTCCRLGRRGESCSSCSLYNAHIVSSKSRLLRNVHPTKIFFCWILLLLSYIWTKHWLSWKLIQNVQRCSQIADVQDSIR